MRDDFVGCIINTSIIKQDSITRSVITILRNADKIFVPLSWDKVNSFASTTDMFSVDDELANGSIIIKICLSEPEIQFQVE